MGHDVLPQTEVATGEAPRNCPLCSRLVQFRTANRTAHPEYFNKPVPSFGDRNGRLLIVGLAPGLHGANKTGRPFTGDYAGDLLYSSLLRHGLARGSYEQRADDELELVDCMITNAVRCAPPANHPTPAEEAACRPFLAARIAALPNLRVIVTLGDVARRNVAKALGARVGPAAGHGAERRIGPYLTVSSYHCSRLNTNTGRLTQPMFEAVFRRVGEVLQTA